MNDWNAWFHEAREVFPRVPFMPTLGNHERQSSNYMASFALPTNAPSDRLREQCYSFDFGQTHWVCLNTEFRMEEQARWLEEDLEGNTKPWILVAFHRPAYTASKSRGGGNLDVRRMWCGLLDRYRVAIVWQGHDHYYVRTKPIREGRVVAEGEGTVYITTGGAGAPLYEVKENRWSHFGEKVNHYVLLTATADRLAATAYRLDGTVLDEFTITK